MPVFRLTMLAYAILLATVGLAFAQTPQTNAIDVGGAFGSFAPYINSIVGALISGLLGWVLLIVKNKLNVSIDDSMRQAVETFLKNQASSLVADGEVKLKGMQVTVSSPALAAAANSAAKLIPDAMAHFGLTPEVIAAKIVDAIPHNPTVAAVAAAQSTPAAPAA